jgi:hypothetical protein
MTTMPSSACTRPGWSGRARPSVVYARAVLLAAAGLVLVGIADAAPAVAESAALYEQGSADAQGKRDAGSVTWSTEKDSGNSLAVRADIVIPDRHIGATWILHRNTDKSLPASHTIDIMFKLPPDFSGHSIASVPGVTMKPSEEARGTPLAGLSVKVTDAYFLFGLSGLQGDTQVNVDNLRDGKWLDILIIYSKENRAILSVEKGATGQRSFDEAFAAWAK